MQRNAYDNIGYEVSYLNWRAVCGESCRHGSERGVWKSTNEYFFFISNSLGISSMEELGRFSNIYFLINNDYALYNF